MCNEACLKSPLPPSSCRCSCHGFMHGTGVSDFEKAKLLDDRERIQERVRKLRQLKKNEANGQLRLELTT